MGAVVSLVADYPPRANQLTYLQLGTELVLIIYLGDAFPSHTVGFELQLPTPGLSLLLLVWELTFPLQPRQ